MRRWALIQTAVFLLLGIAVSTQEAKNPPGLSYLLDGAVRIYVVDESRCSASPDSKEGGRWYLIEGEETLQRLRAALAEVDTTLHGGCACGGPDIHLYISTGGGELRYAGLDCESALEGVPISSDIARQLVPRRPTFVGRPGGQTYLADIPFATPESEAREKAESAGIRMMVGGQWNGGTAAFSRKQLILSRAPVCVDLTLGPYRCDVSPPPPLEEFTREEEQRHSKLARPWLEKCSALTERMARADVEGWLDRSGLRTGLVAGFEVAYSGASPQGTRYRGWVHFASAEAVKSALTKTATEKTNVAVEAVDYRREEDTKAPAYYQAALLLSDSPSPEEIAKAKALLPGIGRVAPLCECGNARPD